MDRAVVNAESASVWAFTPHGRRREEFPIVSHSDGIYFWDTNGKRYLDATSGSVIVNIGYNNKNVLKAMREQAAKTCYASRQFFGTEAPMKLHQTLADLSGPGFDQVFLVSCGSTAVQSAFKLARHYAYVRGETKRWKVIGRMPSFHGSTLGASAASGDPEHDEIYGALMPKMPKVPAPFQYRFPDGFDANSYATHCAEALDRTIKEEGPETCLAFIMEPVGGQSSGALVAPDHYYKMVREICDRHGVLLIFDEVMSGCGRTGKFLAAHHWPDALPDIVVLAKGIGSGYTPIGAIVAPNRIADTLHEAGGWMYSQTMAGNPLSAAVSNAVLEETRRLRLSENAENMGVVLRDRLRTMMAGTHVVGDVRGIGLLNAIEIVANRETKEVFPAHMRASLRIAEIGRENGLMMFARRAADGMFGEFLMMTPPLIITEQQIDDLVMLLDKAIRAYEDEVGLRRENDGAAVAMA